MSDNGELHLFIGQTLADLDRWEAAQAYNDALHRGGLRNPGEALIMQGVAYTTAKQYREKTLLRRQRVRGPCLSRVSVAHPSLSKDQLSQAL